MNKNKELLNAITEWECIVLSDYKSICKNPLSYTFYMGLSEEYLKNSDGKKRVMVVGREPLGYRADETDEHCAEKNTPINSQLWSIAYTVKQTYGENIPLPNCYKNELESNSSAFWHLFRWLNKVGFVPCWNNIDKVYFEKTAKLSYEAEKELSRTYKTEHDRQEKSLLLREIEIAEPDLILFVTGKEYRVSMETALGFDLNEVPTYEKNKSCMVKLSRDVLGKPAYWINHPQGLFGKKFEKEDFFNYIISRLK